MKNPFEESNIISKTILFISLSFTLLLNVIPSYAQKDTISVAFIQGHHEWNEESVSEILDSLSFYCRVDMGMLSGAVGELDGYDVIVIASPQTSFSEAEKYELDQYLMRGGSMLWLLDGCRLSQTELFLKGETPVISLDLNLNDLFFTYGLRMAPTIVKDKQCDSIHVTIESGDSMVPSTLLCPYSIHLLPSAHHSITDGVGEVKGDYLSPIERVEKAEDLTITTLLHSSGKGEAVSLPGMIDLSADNTSFTPDGIHYPVAVLAEGIFPSLFRNRMVPEGVQTTTGTLLKSTPAKIILISAGSMIKDGNPEDNIRFLLRSIRYLARKESDTVPRLLYPSLIAGVVLVGMIGILIRRRKRSKPLASGKE
ncbi:MAG: Gldg family protein [Bacteroidales bacterium]|nr:Gldg family protein [Bacteroidales bacterium]MDD4822081.1 Gldg family protein [Bacteroidales bacterium]